MKITPKLLKDLGFKEGDGLWYLPDTGIFKQHQYSYQFDITDKVITTPKQLLESIAFHYFLIGRKRKEDEIKKVLGIEGYV